MKHPRKHIHAWHTMPSYMRDAPFTGAICETMNEFEMLVDRSKHSSRRKWRDELRLQKLEHDDGMG